MKWIILLFLLFLLVAVLSVKYRKQINAAIKFWNQIQQSSEKKESPQINEIKQVSLIKCAVCGSWTPQSNSLKSGTNITYCSKNCLENSAMKSK